jgi:hypothetical protein
LSAFELLFSLFGLLLGLSIAKLADGFSRIYDQRKTRPIGWLAPGLATVLLIDLMSFWHAAWYWRRLELQFWLVIVVGVLGLSYYFAATQAFPREGSDRSPSDHVMEHRKPVILVVFAANLIMFGSFFVAAAVTDGLAIRDWHAVGLNLAYVAALLAIGFSPSRRWAGLAVAAALFLLLVLSVATIG